MGLEDLYEAPDRGNACAEDVWLAGQRRRGVPVCYLAYTFRLDSVDAALQCGLRGTKDSNGSKTGSRRFCVSEVPAHRVPWQSLGRERDYSDRIVPARPNISRAAGMPTTQHQPMIGRIDLP